LTRDRLVSDVHLAVRLGHNWFAQGERLGDGHHPEVD